MVQRYDGFQSLSKLFLRFFFKSIGQSSPPLDKMRDRGPILVQKRMCAKEKQSQKTQKTFGYLLTYS